MNEVIRVERMVEVRGTFTPSAPLAETFSSLLRGDLVGTQRFVLHSLESRLVPSGEYHRHIKDSFDVRATAASFMMSRGDIRIASGVAAHDLANKKDIRIVVKADGESAGMRRLNEVFEAVDPDFEASNADRHRDLLFVDIARVALRSDLRDAEDVYDYLNARSGHPAKRGATGQRYASPREITTKEMIVPKR